jgi:hypothetical protein
MHPTAHTAPRHRDHSTTRFPVPVDAALRAAGWQPGRWDIRQAEYWADTLRRHTSPGGHGHTVFPAAIEAWAEFGGLHIAPTEPGRAIAPATVHIDPLHGLHMARTLDDLGRALDTQLAPLGGETVADEAGSADGTPPQEPHALLAIDTTGRVYSLDHSGDWYLGQDFDQALGTLLSGTEPLRLTAP